MAGQLPVGGLIDGPDKDVVEKQHEAHDEARHEADVGQQDVQDEPRLHPR